MLVLSFAERVMAALRHYLAITTSRLHVELLPWTCAFMDEDALAKVRQAEKAVHDVCLAATIASQWLTRHATNKLRIYTYVTETLSTCDMIAPV